MFTTVKDTRPGELTGDDIDVTNNSTFVCAAWEAAQDEHVQSYFTFPVDHYTMTVVSDGYLVAHRSISPTEVSSCARVGQLTAGAFFQVRGKEKAASCYM